MRRNERNDRRIPEDLPPDPLPPEALHQQRTSVFFQSSCLLPPPDESDGTTSGISDGTSAGYQPERPPPLFRLDEEEMYSQHSSSSVHQPSSKFEPRTTNDNHEGTRYYQHPPSYHQQQQQQQQQDASQTSYIGEGSFSQSYETASYPGLKILVPRLGFQEEELDDVADSPTVLGSKSPNEENGSILSTLSNEESTYGGLIAGVNNKVLALWMGVLTLLIFAALSMVGTTCAMNLCRWHRSDGGNSTDASVNLDGPLAAPVSSSPAQSPTTRPIETAEVLMQAVDLYLDQLPVTPDSNVSSMYGYPIGRWDVSQITDFSGLFDARRNQRVALFQDDLSDWDTHRATNMSFMFRGAILFNGNVSAFDMTSVVSADSMFDGALSFAQDVSNWNVRKIVSAYRMFRDAISFSGIGLERWELQSVENVEEMFSGALSFRGNVGGWNLKLVTSCRSMFEQTTSFDADLSSWNTERVQNFESMFYCSSISGKVASWDVSQSKNSQTMFAGALRFADDLCSWRSDMVQAGMSSGDAIDMFLSSGCMSQDGPDLVNPASPMCSPCLSTDSLTVALDAGLPIDGAATPQTVALPIKGTVELYIAVDEYLIDNSPTSVASQKYGYPIGAWDVSRITNFSSTFDFKRNPMAADFDEDLDGWNVSSALLFDRMFAGAASFNGNITSWSTSRVRSMAHTFDGAAAFDGDLSRWATAQCEDMSSMFRGARSFTGLGLTNWEVGSLKNMASMFEEAISFQGNLSRWNVAQVSDMSRAFRFAVRWTSDVSNWNVAKVKSFAFSFSGAVSFNSDLSKWTISDSKQLIGMFSGASSFNQSLCNWRPQLAALQDISLTGIFRATACADKNDPDLKALGPFCSNECS